jgi:putative membrane protein
MAAAEGRAQSVEWHIIGLNVLYATVGVVLMFVSYRVIDKLTPEVNFPEELRKGNVAVAIFIAAIFVSIALIIGRALN